MDPLKRKPSGGDEVGTLEAKRTREDQLLPLLPPEIWELIFRNLNAYWLRSVRLTCSNWNQIIHGSRRLMEKFALTLTVASFKNDRKIVRDLLATGRGYTRAAFHIYGIGNHKPRPNWFVPLGTTLHTLSVVMSGTLVLLMQILKETPNLKRLDVVMEKQCTVEAVPDFHLDSLEELGIECFSCPGKLMRFFRQICSRLTVLKVFGSSTKDNRVFEQEFVALVFKVRKSLRELEATLSDVIVTALETMEDLRLARADLWGCSEDCLRLIRCQPNLISLDVSRGYQNMDISTFIEALTTRPKLNALLARFSNYGGPGELSFKNSLNIETLSIKYGHVGMPHRNLLNLSVEDLPNVRNLALSRCKLSDLFLQVLQATTISSLVLHGCCFARLSDLLLLKSLQHVDLGYNRIQDITLPAPGELVRCRVRSLKVTGGKQDFLLAAIAMFQNLEHFDAGSGVDIDERVLCALSQRSQQLKELRFSGCDFASNCPADAAVLFKSLEKFYVMCRFDWKEEHAAALRDLCSGIEIIVKGL